MENLDFEGTSVCTALIIVGHRQIASSHGTIVLAKRCLRR